MHKPLWKIVPAKTFTQNLIKNRAIFPCFGRVRAGFSILLKKEG